MHGSSSGSGHHTTHQTSHPASQETTVIAKEARPENNFSDAEARLIMDWHVQAKYRFAKGHNAQATKYRFWDVYISLLAIIFYTVAATMAMGTERVDDGEVFRYFLCILSVFGTISAFVLAIAQFWHRYEDHKRSGSVYSVFSLDAEAALARSTTDKFFRAQRSLESLYERWKELRGPSHDIPDYVDAAAQAPPKTAENVLRRWQVFAEREMFRNEFAAKAYDVKYSRWRVIWMVIVALSAAASLGTFLPDNTDWPVAFSYISLIFNIFAVIVVSIINVQRFVSLSIQHQNAAAKCRVLHDRTGKLLASRPKSGISQQDLMADALDILQPMIISAVSSTPPIPNYMEDEIAAKFPPNPVQYATLTGTQVAKDDSTNETLRRLEKQAEHDEGRSPGPPTSP